MNRSNALFLVLLAVVLYIALNYGPAHAQQQQPQQTTIRLTKIRAQGGASIQVSGRVLGFSCAPDPTMNAECFVATAD